MAFLVTPSAFLESLNFDAGAIQAETNRVNALPDGALSNQTLLEYSQFLDRFNAFAKTAKDKAEGGIPGVVAHDMSPEDGTLIALEHDFAALEAKTGAPTPLIPRDDPRHPGNQPGRLKLPGIDLPEGAGLSDGTKLLVGLGLTAAILLMLRK